MRLKELQKLANELEIALSALNLEELGLTDAGLSYFKFNLTKIKFNNQSNVYILYRILEKLTETDCSRISIIDHGAGIGFFGLLAKKCGIGQLICHDLSVEMIQDCRKISEALNLGFDHYVVGDTDVLVDYCKMNNLEIHGLASRNVIEHIPDLDLFFGLLRQLPGEELVLVFTTSANIHNPAVHYQHVQIHKQHEVDGPYVDMMKTSINKQNSGRNIRRKIITELAPEIAGDQLEECITNTRALSLEQIKIFVKEFQQTKIIPRLQEKLSNTRDPYSGTWIERLVSYSDYKIVALKNGFLTESLAGFYNSYYSKFLWRIAARSLNVVIKVLPMLHRNLSPFLALRFTRIKSNG
ncbi:MAG: hypothetical protein ABI851_15310 [Saprospiraceae bacterium]